MPMLWTFGENTLKDLNLVGVLHTCATILCTKPSTIHVCSTWNVFYSASAYLHDRDSHLRAHTHS